MATSTNEEPTGKIVLAEEKETLFVPLLGKAEMSRAADPMISDPKAEEIISRVEYDFSGLKAPHKTLVTLAMRAKKLDSYVIECLARSETPLVLHLGCGLDSRVLRTGFSAGEWYDVDYPQVIELRREFYEPMPGYHMVGSSVTERGWLESIGQRSEPACIIAEGLLMYLHAEEVESLFVDLQRQLPGSEIAFDAFSEFTARQANRHPSIKRTGAHIYWGVDDPHEIERWGTGMELLEEWSFTESEDIEKLSATERMMFGVTKHIKMARDAQRILRYRL